MTEDYVSFETAKLLKKKGFEGECQCFYEISPEDGITRVCGTDCHDNKKRMFEYSRPTLQMAMKWLRKEKGIAIIPVITSILDNEKFLWDIKIVVAKTNETYSQGWIYEEPEEAYDTAIKYVLENLI